MNRRKVAVIGGGAAGLAAAIAAAAAADVTVYEKNDRVGKKILQTGNGRCNVMNSQLLPDCYNKNAQTAVERVFSAVGASELERFFGELGLLLRHEDEGRIYPLCNQAAAVLDVLRYAAAERGARLLCGCECKALKRADNGFEIILSTGERHSADAVIIACGGKVAPKTGSDGFGYLLAKHFGHRITALAPALVPIRLNSQICRPLKGIRAKAGVSLYQNGRKTAYESGEIQFGDYGISGIAVMQLSRLINGGEIGIDFAENFGREDILKMLLRAREKNREVQDIALGIVQKRIAQQLIKSCCDISLTAPVSELDENACRRLACVIKDLRLPISGTLSWDYAQVTSGGVALDEIDAQTMQSKLCRGLYFAGEILDCDGKCGGYNLSWAWASGIIAGKNSAGLGN